MKFLVVALVVVVVGWLLLRTRAKAPLPRRGQPAEPQAMVRCLHCGVHLPRGDAIEDVRGVFCSDAHRVAGPRGG